jgi:hypothetical protein
LQEARQALGQGGGGENPNRMENALERARRLARAAESQQERLREQAQGQQGQQGQGQDRGQGQQGSQEGQAPGQSNQNAQQQGDQQGGQQAQGGQGQQGGQRGQQGQGQQGQGGQGQQGQQGEGGNNAQGGGTGEGRLSDGRDLGLNNGVGGGNQINRGGLGFGWEFGRNFALTPEDIRQMRGEIRNWLNDAQALRGDLVAQNIDPRELDEILRQMRQLDDPRVYQNVAELARLQQTVAEGLKRFEFGLRRQNEENQNAVVLSGTDEVPEDFRRLVQEYFKSLSRGATQR